MATKKANLLDKEEVRPSTELATVKIFNCELRLGGEQLHTVPQFGVTKGEIRMMRDIHGEASVVNIFEVGEKDVNEMEELYGLAAKYSTVLDRSSGVRRVERLFGVTLDGFTEWNDRQFDLQEERRRQSQAIAQAKTVRFNQARAAAEARIHAEIASETADNGAA
jgi:hypothetical protein